MADDTPTIWKTEDLLRGLDLHRLDETTWEGPGLVMPQARWVFGGLVAAQALTAAGMTAPDRAARSVRVRFLRQAEPHRPIRHRVSVVADSNTFADRHVAVTSGPDLIATITVVFHTPDVTDLGHQHDLPAVPPPDETAAVRGAGFESIDLNDPPAHSRKPSSPTQRHWMRAPGTPPGELVNAAMLTMASDLFLVASAWRPVPGRSIIQVDEVMSFGLDFTVWFHHRVEIAEWHLLDVDTPSAANGRSLSLANWFRPDGLLVASVALDSVMRVRPDA